MSQEMEDDDPYDRYHHFIEEAQRILKKCGMSEIYIVNPYECFLLMCLLTDCPLAVFRRYGKCHMKRMGTRSR